MPKPEALIRPLLIWFHQNARDLPWRKTTDPYAVWIAEIMLQQTQVKTVIPYWERWMQRLPDLHALAGAKLDQVLKLWEGLGYYTRARNLHRAAQTIVTQHGGSFPSDFAGIIALPGVGRYTAGAVCSIAFNQPTAILDGNVMRVLTRIFAIEENPRVPKTNHQLWELAQRLVGSAAKLPASFTRSCSDFNQALMELGATICTPRQPACALCPVRKYCRARREGRVDGLPNLGKRAAVIARRFIAFVIAADGHFLIRRRAPETVNAHLWEFPNLEVTESSSSIHVMAKACLRFRPSVLEPFCQLQHTITRYRIRLDVFYGQIRQPGLRECQGVRWCKLGQLDKLAFPSAHRKIVQVLKATRMERE